MVSKVSPSETLAWWARAAQARRVASMLSPRDAQLAEAFAVECEDQAREAVTNSIFWPSTSPPKSSIAILAASTEYLPPLSA